jgi:Ca2+-binding RTX toxin-like protein
VLALGLLGFLSFGFASRADARTRCSYVGAPANRLTVTTSRSGLGDIRRRGSEIVVREFLEPPATCSGGVPTVLNTDLIRIVTRAGSYVDLLLAGGPFAPGATPEDEGTSEIEIEFHGPEALGTVVGTSRADAFQWAPGGAHAGLNLNPGAAGDQDVDVTAAGADAFLVAEGRAGNDTLVPAPGARIRDGVFSEGGKGDDRLIAPPHSADILEGGPGDDVIRGRRGSDSLYGGGGSDDIAGGPGADEIEGGRGDDRLSGGRGSDALFGGAGDDDVIGAAGDDGIDGGGGHDLLSAGRGRDFVLSRDGIRDRVHCGRGRDRVRADRRDRLHGCEATRRA